ncbi:ribose-5-phosphate isomerase [Clostridium sp. 19966]|uniref:ribose-5-phosphate isomerase n=1 Tax=Clostridium sp. 19966 TaxID=2768166 RepID=UPI0028DE5D85|nr:ribose-5-phosphate isomerase [Clostridium sp. 19966]MDT8715607.1 ribose-5-phosphate isomerase [Clostridium sp. 19966]
MGYYNEERYELILEVICSYKGIKKEEINKILKDRECKYFLFLLLNQYRCFDCEKVKQDFNYKSNQAIKNNIKKAEEKFFINREFREKFFEVQKIAKKII